MTATAELPLEQVSALAARPFRSRDEAIGAILDLIYRTSGMRTPFLARTNQGRFEVMAVDQHGGCSVSEGDTLPLTDSY